MQVVCTGAREQPDDWDGPDPITGACGATFEFDPEPWDIKTDVAGNVVRRHRSALCPACGTATFVVEGV